MPDVSKRLIAVMKIGSFFAVLEMSQLKLKLKSAVN